MTIPADYTVPPLSPPISNHFIEDGNLTQQSINFLRQLRDFLTGTNRIIPCDAVGSNSIVLTPSETAPVIQRYCTYDIYAFRAVANSTGSVTITVAPRPIAPDHTLATVNAYKSNGATQAGNGDIVADSVYLAVFAEHLNSNAGGFVLK